MLALLVGLLAGPVAAQNATKVTITGSNPATFSRVGQLLTFNVQLYTGNTGIDSLTFTSGSPTGMSGLTCPGLPAGVLATTNCTFTYTTQAIDLALGKVTALGRWRATRPTGAPRSGVTNTLEVLFAVAREPDAPLIGTATAGNAQATVAFTAPGFDGGQPIGSYTATSSPGGMTATGSGSPITVSGLTNGVVYTFTVTATNIVGTSLPSAASNSVTPKDTQTITFTNPGAQNFGTAPTLSATASSGLPVAYTSSTTAVCTITGAGALAFVSTGTCTISADQAGNAAFSPAAQVSQSFAVNAVVPGAPTIGTATAGDTQATVTFTAPAFTGGATITGYTVTSSPGGITASGAGSPITITGLTNGTAYTFTVTATNGAGTGAPSSASNSVTPKGAQTITFANPGAQHFGTTPTLTATASSGLPVTFTSSTTGVCTITGAGALAFVSSGTCTINADQADIAAFSPAVQVSQSFAVNAVVPGAPTIGTATAGDTQATVTFVPPAFTGGATITGYTATSSPGGITGSGAGSPISITGLTNGSAYTFTVTATNGAGTGAPSAASNSVVPSSTPVVTSVIVPANGLHGPGQNLDFTVHWDQPVLVTGTPRIALVIGATTVQAEYLSGSGSSATSFRYTVLTGQSDSNGITVGALALNGGSIRNGYDVDASLTLNAMASTAWVLVGVVPPSITAATYNVVSGVLVVTGTDFPSAAGSSNDIVASRFTMTGAGGASYSLTDTANVEITSSTAFTLVLSATDRAALAMLVDKDGTSAVGGVVYNLAAAEDWAAGADPAQAVADLTGNGMTASGVDATPPAVTTIDRLDASPTQATSVRFSVAFSENVTGVDVSDFALTSGGTAGGSIASVAAMDAAHYAVTVDNISGDGTLRLDLKGSGTGIADAAGNLATGFAGGQTYVFDHTAPTVTSVTVPANGQYVEGQSLAFTVNFSEAVTVTVTGTPYLPLTLDVGGARQALYVSGSGTNALAFSYTVVAGDQDLDGITVGAAFALNGGTVMDVVGHAAVTTLNGVGNTTGVLVGLLPQAITGFAANPAAPVYVPDGTFTVAATGGASGNPVVFASTTASVCTVRGGTMTMLSAGTCSLTANQAGNANYETAPQVALDVAIGAGSQAITFGAQTGRAFTPNGTFALSPVASASSGLPVSYTSQTAGVCTISGTTVTMLSAGTCTIAADQAGDANYAAATQVAQAIAIGKAAQVITGLAANPGAPVYAPNGTFTVSATGGASGAPVVFATTTASVCTISGSTVTMLSAGTCTIAADQVGDANYTAAAQVTLDIAIGKAAQVITGLAANPEAPIYAPNGTFTVSATGSASGTPVAFATTTASVCTISGSTVTMLSAGTCSLTANQAGNASYEAAPQVAFDVAIGKATPTLAWSADIAKTYGERAFDLADPTSDGAGAFTFASSNAQVATVSGRTVTIIGEGATTLTAMQAASANYAAGSISLVLTVDGRPDPTRDPSVAAGMQAQVDASVRFAQAQQDNIRGRLGQLRGGSNASSNAVALNLHGSIGQPGMSLSADQAQGAMPNMPQGWGFWTAGSVILGERDASDASQGFEFHSDGVSFGVDRMLGDTMVLGAAGGFGWNDSDLDDGRSSLDARQRSFAMYGLWRSGAMFVDGILGWGRLDFDINRWSDVATATATAQREGDQAFGSLTLGYEFQGDQSVLTGYGRLDASRTTLDAYREHGLGIHDLQYATQDVDSSTAAAGVEGRYTLRTESAMVRPYWMLEWRQALQNQGDASMNYVVLPRSSDYVLGLRSYNDDTLGFGAGVDVGFGSGWNLAFQVRREQSRDVYANTFGLRLSYGQLPRLLASEPLLQPGDQTGLAMGASQPQP